ncbi:hypothetical protein DNTS_009701, partial [Danionella cerebrum]
FKKEEGGFDENLTAHPLPQYSSERRPLSDRKEHKETFQSSTLQGRRRDLKSTAVVIPALFICVKE